MADKQCIDGTAVAHTQYDAQLYRQHDFEHRVWALPIISETHHKHLLVVEQHILIQEQYIISPN